jgi:UDP-N-acetylmuramate--alanine ligase
MIRMQRIHFVGIGGSGMSGIAEILLAMNYKVSGSDLAASTVTDRLAGLGARVAIGHRAENVGEVDAIVISSAVGHENPEVRLGRERGIPIVPRAEMLAELMRLKYGIAIGGTHGKTTTTSMISLVLTAGGLDPTVIIGGRLEQLGSGAKRGTGDYFVAEADESDGSFLKLSPTVSVVTNIDDDHLDHYGDMGRLTATFGEFLNKVPFYGFGVVCIDDPRLRGIVAISSRRMATYGFSAEAEVRADDVRVSPDGARYRLIRKGEVLGEVALSAFGVHNVANSLAAATVGLELGMPPTAVIRGLGDFAGVDRRLEFKGAREVDGGRWRVYDDYGHHPTEVTATIAAARAMAGGGRVIVVFQPHRYSRTALLHDKFASALAAADRLWLLPIYPAGEPPRQGVDSSLIADSLRLKGYAAVSIASLDEIVPPLFSDLRAGDVVLTMGAGNVTTLGARLLEAKVA